LSICYAQLASADWPAATTAPKGRLSVSQLAALVSAELRDQDSHLI